MINIKPLYAVAVLYPDEDEAVVIKETISHQYDHVAVLWDTKRFSSPPCDCVIFYDLANNKAVKSSQGVEKPKPRYDEWKPIVSA